MEKNNSAAGKIGEKFREAFKKTPKLFARWIFLASLTGVAVFCVFVWYAQVFRADWDEVKKQQYVNEQAKFSFDKVGYQKMVEMMRARRDKLENFPKFTGRDIFFPEGF